MATLWLSSSADKTITVGDTISLTAYCDPTTVSSGISSYKAKVLLDDYRTSGPAVSWSTTSSGSWKATCRYTFDEAGTYDVCVCICNSSGDSLGQYTGWITVYVEEESAYSQTITYYSGTSSRTQTIDEYDYLLSEFNVPSGYTFLGWATTYNTKTVTYDAGEYYEATSNSGRKFYAVFYKSDTIYCYYGENESRNNTRSVTTYTYNRSSGATSRTTSCDNITLPTFASAGLTVLGRSFPPIGWRSDTTAAAQQYNPGATVNPSGVSAYYAVYENTDGITVSYDANGGSGTMADATVSGTLYYNTSGNYSEITVTPRTCTFTAPSGLKFGGWCCAESDYEIVTAIATAFDITFIAYWISSRPNNWSWTSTVSNGASMPYTQTGDKTYNAKPLTATEWNNFIDRIFEFYDYKEVSYSGSTSGFYVTAGTKMLAETVDLARQLIAVLNPPTSLPSAISRGGKITAAYINGLKNSLNSIE